MLRPAIEKIIDARIRHRQHRSSKTSLVIERPDVACVDDAVGPAPSLPKDQKILLRLIHPCAGEVRIQGIPLDCVSREAISRLVGYVGQSPFLFAGTIEENIAYGAGPCSPDDIRLAAQKACIHHEITRMPNGYLSAVAERGANLSGGQRQRLALARVFLKNPPILVLDEATAALDAISERQVQEAIAKARADRTVILVSAPTSTVADADRIIVFDDGRVTEQGRYRDLLRGQGVFAEMVRSEQAGV